GRSELYITIAEFSVRCIGAPAGRHAWYFWPACATAAPVAAPAAAPITVPLVLWPMIWPRIAPAIAPPITFFLSAFGSGLSTFVFSNPALGVTVASAR